jgi:uncharacterized repeat protein (TIGR03847 family)
MSEDMDFDAVDRLTAGTVGEPGQRVFHLQVVSGRTVVSLKAEKAQVAALARYLADLLADLPSPDDDEVPRGMDLVEPVVDEWPIGQLVVAYHPDPDRFELRAEEMVPEPEGTDDVVEGGSLRVVLTRGQVQAFIVQAATLMAGGRPPCPLCGRPIDTDGHLCVKTNGHKS